MCSALKGCLVGCLDLNVNDAVLALDLVGSQAGHFAFAHELAGA